MLYIFWFLHQTTTSWILYHKDNGCISFDSYIKPQLLPKCTKYARVVYLLIPTSNHNKDGCRIVLPFVVYLLIPTSNHNKIGIVYVRQKLYIFWFLHQTTTLVDTELFGERCISFDSYIKPQLGSVDGISESSCISFDSYIKPQLSLYLLIMILGCISFDSYIKPQPLRIWGFLLFVVYLLIPTSNHNQVLPCIANCQLYIFWFLHQTTTCGNAWAVKGELYIFWFLHQTTTERWRCQGNLRCISFDSYIKPQLNLSFMMCIICCISFDSYIKPQLSLGSR